MRGKKKENDVLAELLDLLNLGRELVGEGFLEGLQNKAIVSAWHTMRRKSIDVPWPCRQSSSAHHSRRQSGRQA